MALELEDSLSGVVFLSEPCGKDHEQHRAPLAYLEKNPQFPVAKDEYLKDFKLIEKINRVNSGSSTEIETQEVITELKERLLLRSPILSILTGRVVFNDPEFQLPLSFKLNAPKLKELNKVFGESSANELMKRVKKLVQDKFSSEGNGLPGLSLLPSLDPKGGKALLNLKSSFFEGKSKLDAMGDFSERVERFQEDLDVLVQDFYSENGKDCPVDLKPRMLFGVIQAWDLVEEDKRGSVESLVEHFNLSEGVANLAKLRFLNDRRDPRSRREVGVNPNVTVSRDRQYASGAFHAPRRKNTTFSSARRFSGFLEMELRKIQPHFQKLYFAQKDNKEWQGIFVEIVNDEGEYRPFVTLEFLDALRKGKVGARFPKVSPDELQIIANYIEVVNTVDILKPFLEEDAELFYKRLKETATLLKEEPQDARGYMNRLVDELKRSYKDPEKEDEDPIGQTQFAVSQRIYEILCEKKESAVEPEDAAYIDGDVRALGAEQIFEISGDVYEFYDALNTVDRAEGTIVAELVRSNTASEVDEKLPQLLPAIKHLLKKVGDTVSRKKRAGDRLLLKSLSGGKVAISVDGGDEYLAISSMSDLKKALKEFIDKANVRMAITHFPKDLRELNIEDAARLAAGTKVFSSAIMNVIKDFEASSNTIVGEPVNISISH